MCQARFCPQPDHGETNSFLLASFHHTFTATVLAIHLAPVKPDPPSSPLPSPPTLSILPAPNTTSLTLISIHLHISWHSLHSLPPHLTMFSHSLQTQSGPALFVLPPTCLLSLGNRCSFYSDTVPSSPCRLLPLFRSFKPFDTSSFPLRAENDYKESRTSFFLGRGVMYGLIFLMLEEEKRG